jgi:hypothetical protein
MLPSDISPLFFVIINFLSNSGSDHTYQWIRRIDFPPRTPLYSLGFSGAVLFNISVTAFCRILFVFSFPYFILSIV